MNVKKVYCIPRRKENDEETDENDVPEATSYVIGKHVKVKYVKLLSNFFIRKKETVGFNEECIMWGHYNSK